jgi:hypothetical protein
MRLEAALRHLLLVLRRHARDHRHHPLGREIVDELRLRLVEPGRVRTTALYVSLVLCTA